jgi:predicted ATPase/DNA-binding SARP family transcriptional activator/Tfp pilus assembly protein PilF
MPSEPPANAHITYSRQYRRCRKAGCSRCSGDQPGHGPYWFAYWREAGRVHSRYVGKNVPGLAEPGPVAVIADPAHGSRRFTVRTLGTFVVMHGDTAVPASAWRRRSVPALFTRLLSARHQRLHREQLIDDLWPELDPSLASRELHRAMHALRTILGQAGAADGAVRHEGEMIVLEPASTAQPGGHWLDAELFERAAGTAVQGQDRTACREAVRAYGGTYLPDDPYSEWVALRREELRGRYLSLLVRLAELSGTAGDRLEEEQCLRSVLREDACQEDAAAALIGLLGSAGRRTDALRVYHALATALDANLGLAPSSVVETLRARLLESDVARAPVEHRSPAPVSPLSGNLPAAVNSFVGRGWEIGEIQELLTHTRLVTLTGPGGCGKSRLALEAARGLEERYPAGMWLIELAALLDASLVPWMLGTALGLPAETMGKVGAALIAELRAFLRPRRVLLVLDNCEHLIGACAELVGTLLAGCPDLRVLTTSREALRIGGETTWLVSPLATPAGRSLSPAVLLQGEAVRLFVDRAHAARPGFALTEHNASAVLQICRRLDGLPLALELAAARLGTLPVEAIADRLDDCFALLTGGSRTALPRQQTLRATMDWSYGLLSPAQQCLLRRLSVFVGGCTSEAAAAMGAAESGDRPCEPVEEFLAELTHRSLVQVSDQTGSARYSLLETVRHYAREQLITSGESAGIHDRHRAWYLDQLSRAGAASTTERGSWLSRLALDIDNIRAVLASCKLSGSGRQAMLLRGEPIAQLCLMRGYVTEGRRWLGAALHDGNETIAQRAVALNALAILASEQGDYLEANLLYEEGLAAFTGLGDSYGAARVLINQGNVAKYQGDPVRARALYRAGTQYARDHGHAGLLAIALNNQGTLSIELGEYEAARTALEESLELKRQSGSQSGVVQVLLNLGEVARADGDIAHAEARYEEALALALAIGDRSHVALLHYNLGLMAAARHSNVRAAVEFRHGLREEQELGNKRRIAANLEGLAALAATPDHARRAGRLLGAATRLREEIGAPIPDVDRPNHERSMAIVREVLGGADSAKALADGRAMTLDMTIVQALDDAS